MERLRGHLLLPDRVIDGELTIHGARITRIRRCAVRHPRYIAPGFVDLHLWGEPHALAQKEIRGGTTSFVTTLGPLPRARLVEQLTAWSAPPPPTGARWLGIHLEGPWVHRRQAGALNAAAVRPPRLAEAQRAWAASGEQIRLVTVAPEGVSRDFIQWWRRRGVAVSCGHTAASYDETRRGIAAGMRCATHLWNKMGSPHQRRPGAIGALLEDPRVLVMLLVDGRHLHPTTVTLIHRVIGTERLVLATDSMRHVTPEDDAVFGLRRGRVRGQLAGTRLTMIEAVKNLRAFTGVTLSEAVRMASLNPARVLGLERRQGSLAVGKEADLVVFDRHWRVLHTLVSGRVVYQR